MDEQIWLVKQFEEHRPRLLQVAYRMLGTQGEAEDAVQESWLKLSRADTSEVMNLGGWLTTVVARVCLDMLRARKARRENLVGLEVPDSKVDAGAAEIDPEQEALLADSIGPALIIVMETLSPAERVAYVLHDVFDVPFDEVALVLGRSTVAARQLASRARRRVRLVTSEAGAEREKQREIVEAFLAAAREGDFESLLALLSPGVAVRADSHAVRLGALEELTGSRAVADRFVRYAKRIQFAFVDGTAALAAFQNGEPRLVLLIAIENQKIARVDMVADPARLSVFEIALLEG